MIRRESVFKKDEPAACPQDTSNASNGLYHAGNRAQGERAHYRIHRTIAQRDVFTRKIQEFDIQVRPAMLFCKANHARVRFQSIDLAHFFGIVENEIDARTDTDLEDFPLCQGDHPLTHLPDGFRVSQRVHETWVDMVSIEGHWLFSVLLRCPDRHLSLLPTCRGLLDERSCRLRVGFRLEPKYR